MRAMITAAERLALVPPSESELVERARAGDHGAYGELVRSHEEVAFRVAYTIVGSAHDAEDVTQEAFVKAYRALGSFRAGAPFRPWLLRIVGNEARNSRRASGRRAFHQGRAAVLEPVYADERPEDRLERSERGRRLFAAVDGLEDGQRQAILARYVIGLTDEETAAALGISRATVKMRAWRGLERLRRTVGEELR